MEYLADENWPCEDVIVEACKNCNDKACCKNFLVPLTPPERLRLKTYDKYLWEEGPDAFAILAKKENMECYYLTSQGCSIWSSRPNACREYSCVEESTFQISIRVSSKE
ncbi:MAG TPA: YkgJ family cysteine cluster protein [Methylomusa anaerophila]|uniref:Flagellin N-methylase n=1 Tax=Methylomusa anaerophila TaxID=1930071 RepID=A0A348AHE7_9FIRM|nr:YkgJ family cysteine cluster protein [Methylomusa anaerophila]BBB90495.1 flagellin N-methylase [Methylomusa anaerophila]HML89863.1 YkgJ family cysteine cluster protein [Methylomusa anaerophila]